MPLNAAGQSFAPNSVLKIYSPTATEGTVYSNLSSAQCAANSALTSVSVTSAGDLVDAAKVRTTGITLIVPNDQSQVTFGNDDPRSATISPTPIVAIPPVNTFPNQVTQSGVAPSSNGFALPPGASVFLHPCNDAIYAITPTGASATIYFIDT